MVGKLPLMFWRISESFKMPITKIDIIMEELLQLMKKCSEKKDTNIYVQVYKDGGGGIFDYYTDEELYSFNDIPELYRLLLMWE